MRKLWKFMSVALCGAMLLTGCGNSGSEKDSGNNDASDEKEQLVYTFSEIKNSGELLILYMIFNDDGVLAKDSVPELIYILDDGKIYIDKVDGTTFGEYSKMTDEEIQQYVIENGRKGESYYVNNADYEIAVYTDSTGNNTDYEALLVQSPYLSGAYIEELMYIYDNVTIGATVYDSTYAGMNWNNTSWKSRQGYLWYRNSDGMVIEKDTPNVEGILVDPEGYCDDYDDR